MGRKEREKDRRLYEAGHLLWSCLLLVAASLVYKDWPLQPSLQRVSSYGLSILRHVCEFFGVSYETPSAQTLIKKVQLKLDLIYSSLGPPALRPTSKT